MTFSSVETRDTFHKLPAGTQVLIHSLWAQAAKQGFFFHVEAADSDIIIRVSVQPNPLMASHLVSDGNDESR